VLEQLKVWSCFTLIFSTFALIHIEIKLQKLVCSSFSQCDGYDVGISRVNVTVCFIATAVRRSHSTCIIYFIRKNIIEDLQKQGFGCRIGTRYLACIMYADDLVLLSPSLNALQLMIDQCKMSCESLGLSWAMRVGPAFKHDCVKVRLGIVEVEYVDMIKYLGVHICSASKFKLSYNEVKASFHWAVSVSLCKTKGKFDDIVMLRLVDAYCKPLLLYGSDACIPFKKSIALCFLENILVLMKQLTACEIQI